MQESTQMLCNFSMGYMSLYQMIGCKRTQLFCFIVFYEYNKLSLSNEVTERE